MSLFSWLSPKKKAAPPQTAPQSSGLSRMESTKPYAAAARQGGAPNAQPANRKQERMARRELLYSVVRDAMVHAGVLSSSYKFKVLSLDPRGRQFLVMVDLSAGAATDTARLAEIEALIAQQARARFDILVTAVYWRSIEHVAVGDPAVRPVPSRPAPLQAEPPQREAPTSQPAELMPAPAAHRHGRHEPLHPDEMTAFRQALATGMGGAQAMQQAHAATRPAGADPQANGGAHAKAFDGSLKHGPQSYTLLTGFEDTEMADDGAEAASGAALSATQYGDLR